MGRSDPRTHRAHAVGASAGRLAIRTIVHGLGLSHPAWQLSPQDQADIDRAREACGVAPADAADFAQELHEEAAAHVQAHRHAFGALVEALVTQRTLDAAAIADLWKGRIKIEGANL